MDRRQYLAAGANSPLATDDQKAVERLALALLARPDIQALAAATADEIKALIPHGPLSAAIFDREFEQLRFLALEAAINSVANHPRLHAVSLYPHLTDGIEIPGTKSLHPSPDFAYRLAPVDDAACFILRGRKPARGPRAFEISLIGANEATQGNLSIGDLDIADDGSFTVTVDPRAADGRVNHLRSAAGAQQLIIRDIFDDIAHQRPMALTIERLDPPCRPALTLDEVAARVPGQLTKAVRGVMAVTGIVNRLEANVMNQPAFFNQGETLVTQAYSMAHFRLRADQALVIQMTMGSAGYAIIPATNYWGGIGDFLNHRTCISSPQALPNPDGSLTFVVARGDPGVANWVDTDGLDEGTLCARWTAFRQDGGPMPTLEARLVTLGALDATLPPGTPRYDAAARQARILQHASDYSAWSRG